MYLGKTILVLIGANMAFAHDGASALRHRELQSDACSFSRTFSKPSGTSQGTLVDKNEMIDLGVTLEARGNLTHTCTVSCVGGNKGQLYVKYGDNPGANPAKYDVSASNNDGCSMSTSLYMENNEDSTMPGSIDVTYWLKVWQYDEVTLTCDCGGSEGVVAARTGGIGGGTCFSEDAEVQVLHKGTTAMKDLKAGDQVSTGKGFQTVYGFGHYHPTREAEFLQIYAEGVKAPLEMTAEHMVFVSSASGTAAIRAGDLKKGYELVMSGPKQTAAVTNIKSVVKEGLYMPLTEDGTIAVNDVLCSNYVSLESGAPTAMGLSQSLFGLSEHTVFHWFLAPLRMLCMGVSSEFCTIPDPKVDAHEDAGISGYLLMGRSLVQWMEAQSTWVQLCLGFALFCVFGSLMLLEATVGSGAVPAVIAGASIQYYRSATNPISKVEG